MERAPELPTWVKDLLHELYHPLGKRRMAEAFAPLKAAALQLAQTLQQAGRGRQ